MHHYNGPSKVELLFNSQSWFNSFGILVFIDGDDSGKEDDSNKLTETIRRQESLFRGKWKII